MKDKSCVLEESLHDEIQRFRHINQCVVKCHNPLEKIVPYTRLSYNLPHHQDLQEKFCKAEQDYSGIYGTGLRLLSKLLPVSIEHLSVENAVSLGNS
jgi:hypothetical protein